MQLEKAIIATFVTISKIGMNRKVKWSFYSDVAMIVITSMIMDPANRT